MVKFFKSQWQDVIPIITFWILSSPGEGLWQYVLAGVLTLYWFTVIMFRYWWKDV